MIRIFLAALLGVVLAQGCSLLPKRDVDCDAGLCVCDVGDECAFDCRMSGCSGTCDHVDVCDGSCRGDCVLLCTNVPDCNASCGDACRATCEGDSGCDIECGVSCEVTCRDTSRCDVRMTTGRLTCEGDGECVAACVTDDAMEAALDCGGGVFACGQC